MRWKNLTEDKCPKCGAPLFTNNYEPGTGINCSTVGMKALGNCDFFITQERFQELKKKMGDDASLREITSRDNQEALNNL